MKEKVYVYMLRSLKDHRFYVGITDDIRGRLNKHNRGEVKSTKNRTPFKIVYNKEYNNYEEARRHEKWLKKKNKDYKEVLAQLAPPDPAHSERDKIGGVK